ncbi:hypothetical protein B0A55_13754, partial [Friedmanniomyces simplex]
ACNGGGNAQGLRAFHGTRCEACRDHVGRKGCLLCHGRCARSRRGGGRPRRRHEGFHGSR